MIGGWAGSIGGVGVPIKLLELEIIYINKSSSSLWFKGAEEKKGVHSWKVTLVDTRLQLRLGEKHLYPF